MQLQWLFPGGGSTRKTVSCNLVAVEYVRALVDVLKQIAGDCDTAGDSHFATAVAQRHESTSFGGSGSHNFDCTAHNFDCTVWRGKWTVPRIGLVHRWEGTGLANHIGHPRNKHCCTARYRTVHTGHLVGHLVDKQATSFFASTSSAGLRPSDRVGPRAWTEQKKLADSEYSELRRRRSALDSQCLARTVKNSGQKLTK